MLWPGDSEVTCSLRVKLPPFHLSTTYGGGFAPSCVFDTEC